MKMMYRNLPDGKDEVVDGLEARAIVRKALIQVTADLDALAEMMPDAISTIMEEKRKLRRRAVDALHRGETIATIIDSNGYPLGGMMLSKGLKIVGVINSAGQDAQETTDTPA